MLDFQQVTGDVCGRVQVWENEPDICWSQSKINGTYYCEVLLTDQLLPVMREISAEFFIFQQDSAPLHRTRETINLLEWETPAFIAPDLWLSAFQIWTQFTTEFGKKCSSGSDRQKFMTLMNWSTVCHVWRVAWNKVWLLTQSVSGTNVSVHVWYSCQKRTFWAFYLT